MYYLLQSRFPSQIYLEVRGQRPLEQAQGVNLFLPLPSTGGTALWGPRFKWKRLLANLAPWTEPELC